MIRPIEPRDYDRFSELAGQLGYPVTAEFAAAQLTKESLRSDSVTFVYDEPSAGVVGWVACRIVERSYRRPYGEIAGLVIDKAHRSRGYGAELLAEAEDWFRAQSVPEVLVRSNTLRTEAHRFYDREGYFRAKTQQVFTKDLES
jgi:GNAT superfamily N-acetyltransferase